MTKRRADNSTIEVFLNGLNYWNWTFERIKALKAKIRGYLSEGKVRYALASPSKALRISSDRPQVTDSVIPLLSMLRVRMATGFHRGDEKAGMMK
jgi:hypothetical protein